ncbi:MAG: J domain-containing protein [Nitrococcus sp.]|nr:J domain-containing protein [Nitrococcus sp.]
MKDPWKTLRIMPTRDLARIKTAYRAHAQKYHPDKALSLEEARHYTLRFIELREAYRNATLMAQYESDLQPLGILHPTDLSKNSLLSNEWFVGAIAIAAGLFGFWLVWLSAPHYAVHTLPMTQSVLFVALTRMQSCGRQRQSQRNALRWLARFASGVPRRRATVCQPGGFLLHCRAILAQWW